MEQKKSLNEYTEDFEDYESDFEDYTAASQTSEHSLHSDSSLINKTTIMQTKAKKSSHIYIGRKLLTDMIKLDTVYWSLYEAKPLCYDDFIKFYGKFNTQQICTETHGNSVDIGVQSSDLEFHNKWTQYPIKCRNKLISNDDVKEFWMENIGVGGDVMYSDMSLTSCGNTLQLNNFLSKAGKVILILLGEKQFDTNTSHKKNSKILFSEGYCKLSIDVLPFLSERQVTILHCSDVNNKILISIHERIHDNKITEDLNKQDTLIECCIGCIWNLHNPSRPLKLFYSHSRITACCFYYSNNNIIFAGLENGSICLWDVQEEEIYHQKVVYNVNEIDCIIRSPTFTTFAIWKSGMHLSPIVAIRVLSRTRQYNVYLKNKFTAFQICSLDENGQAIVWSVLNNFSYKIDDIGLTKYGKVKLIKSQELYSYDFYNSTSNLKVQFMDMNIQSIESKNIYLVTNGAVLRVLRRGTTNDTIFHKATNTGWT